MTNERIAIEALARCTFLPASWNKRFARSLEAMPEDTLLSVKQRQCLWKLVHRYRRQMPPVCLDFLKVRLAWHPTKLAFEDELDTTPDDAVAHSVYADWLDENGELPLANAQRWMVERGIFPFLLAGGRSFSSEGTKPINFEWSLGMEAFEIFGCIAGQEGHLPYWHRSRQEAEANLAKALPALEANRAKEFSH